MACHLGRITYTIWFRPLGSTQSRKKYDRSNSDDEDDFYDRAGGTTSNPILVFYAFWLTLFMATCLQPHNHFFCFFLTHEKNSPKEEDSQGASKSRNTRVSNREAQATSRRHKGAGAADPGIRCRGERPACTGRIQRSGRVHGLAFQTGWRF